MKITNVLSVDLEFWLSRMLETEPLLQALDHTPLLKRIFDETVVQPTGLLLKLFADQSVTTTFFATTSLFTAAPALLREIAARGHEIAFHGHTHNDAAPLAEQLERSADFIRTFRITGFRAPEMAFPADISPLVKAGFTYDSSTYGAAPYILAPSAKGPVFVECPVACDPAPSGSKKSAPALMLTGKFPVGSGILLSLLSAGSISRRITRLNARNIPAVLFVHQWQLVSRRTLVSLAGAMARASIPGLSKLKPRDAYSLMTVPPSRLRGLLQHHPFGRMDALAKHYANP